MKSTIKEWIKTIIISLVIALVITTVVRPTLVKGYSMYPTISENDYLLINKMSYVKDEPEHGDIIVFKTTLADGNGHEKDLIKRVIATEGDTIEVLDGNVFLNDEKIEENYINGDYTPNNVKKKTIGEDHIFVMGDNRPNSLDSRDSRVGEVDTHNIKGKVLIRLFPFNKIGIVK